MLLKWQHVKDVSAMGYRHHFVPVFHQLKFADEKNHVAFYRLSDGLYRTGISPKSILFRKNL